MKIAQDRSSVMNLDQDFEPFTISLILDGSLMQGAQQPYLDKGAHQLDMATTGCAKWENGGTEKWET